MLRVSFLFSASRSQSGEWPPTHFQVTRLVVPFGPAMCPAIELIVTRPSQQTMLLFGPIVINEAKELLTRETPEIGSENWP